MSDFSRREFMKRLGKTGVGVGIATLLGRVPQKEEEPGVEQGAAEQLLVSARGPLSACGPAFPEDPHGQ